MDIMSLTAVELGKKIKAKEISVTEATQAYLDQIEKVENDVHERDENNLQFQNSGKFCSNLYFRGSFELGKSRCSHNRKDEYG